MKAKEPEQQVLTAEALTLPEAASSDKWDRLVEIAIRGKAGAEQFAMLVEAITKARREDARLQFEAALGRFKEHLPAVFKTKKVVYANKDGSQTSYSHAELDIISEIIADELRKEGLTHSWRPSEGANGRTIVTCVFRHPASGHVEDMATLGAPPDTSGGKNSVQAIGSSNYYLERYTLLAAAGIVPKGIDDDGRAAEGMNENVITDYCVQMQDASAIGPQTKTGTLQFIFAECYGKANSMGDKSARDRFVKVYNERKKALWGVGK